MLELIGGFITLAVAFLLLLKPKWYKFKKGLVEGLKVGIAFLLSAVTLTVTLQTEVEIPSTLLGMSPTHFMFVIVLPLALDMIAIVGGKQVHWVFKVFCTLYFMSYVIAFFYFGAVKYEYLPGFLWPFVIVARVIPVVGWMIAGMGCAAFAFLTLMPAFFLLRMWEIIKNMVMGRWSELKK